uniref:Uncharacterized protein n=1 Tax=Rhizophora mucronata TaxID=61149 RepID=A0A2P2QWD1_RHIMU
MMLAALPLGIINSHVIKIFHLYRMLTDINAPRQMRNTLEELQGARREISSEALDHCINETPEGAQMTVVRDYYPNSSLDSIIWKKMKTKRGINSTDKV